MPLADYFLLPIENKILKFLDRSNHHPKFSKVRVKNHKSDGFLLVACFLISKVLV